MNTIVNQQQLIEELQREVDDLGKRNQKLQDEQQEIVESYDQCIKGLNDGIDQLTEERDQLAARNARLEWLVEQGKLREDYRNFAMESKVFNESPAASLAYVEVATLKKYGKELATQFFYWFNKRCANLDPKEGYDEYERRHGGVLYAEIEEKAKQESGNE